LYLKEYINDARSHERQILGSHLRFGKIRFTLANIFHLGPLSYIKVILHLGKYGIFLKIKNRAIQISHLQQHLIFQQIQHILVSKTKYLPHNTSNFHSKNTLNYRAAPPFYPLAKHLTAVNAITILLGYLHILQHSKFAQAVMIVFKTRGA